jgi:hypothetical protein
MAGQRRGLIYFGVFAAAALNFAGCGGSGSSMGQMTLSVGDAPVDGARNVVVEFTGVELVGRGQLSKRIYTI